MDVDVADPKDRPCGSESRQKEKGKSSDRPCYDVTACDALL